MASQTISADFPFTKHHMPVLDSTIAYVDTGLPNANAPIVVFLHGNPTSSYLYRNIIPHVSPVARCIAPDLVGFGDSSKMPSNGYYFHDHVRYLATFMADVVLKDKSEKIFLVVHDWGSVLGFDWASKNPSRIAGLVFMEFMLPSLSLKDFPDAARALFTDFRTKEKGRKLIIEENIFIEVVLGQIGTIRDLSDLEMRYYREPFLDPKNREPLYRFPNEIPLDGYPANMAKTVENFWGWMRRTEVPKLMFWAKPGALVSVEMAREIATSLKNIRSIDIGAGSHYLQEDNPHLIGAETSKFVQEVLNMSQDFGA